MRRSAWSTWLKAVLDLQAVAERIGSRATLRGIRDELGRVRRRDTD